VIVYRLYSEKLTSTPTGRGCSTSYPIAGLDWPLCHCPFDEHRRPLAPSRPTCFSSSLHCCWQVGSAPFVRSRCDCSASSAPFTNIQTYLLTYLRRRFVYLSFLTRSTFYVTNSFVGIKKTLSNVDRGWQNLWLFE